MAAPTPKPRASPSGPGLPEDGVPTLAEVLAEGNDAGGAPIAGLGAPGAPDSAARLADVAAVFSLLTVGRILVSSPVGTGPQTLPLTSVSGFSVAADRVEVGGPAIVLAQWNAKIDLGDPCTFRLATTSEGAETQGPVTLPSPVDFFWSASAFWLAADPDEELWLTTDSAGTPTISAGKLTIVKIPL